MLDPEATVLENAMRCGRRHSESVARSVLGRFLFPGDDVFKKAAVLSGGEKSRLALVKILLNPPNLLMLDEPTIHLDIQSVQALIDALEGYTGTLITISHDVHFLRRTVNAVVRIEQGSMRRYPGGYGYYEEKYAQEQQEALIQAGAGNGKSDTRDSARGADKKAAASAPEGARGFKSKEQKRKEAEHRKLHGSSRRKLEQRLQRVESRVLELESRQKVLVGMLEDPETYSRPELAQQYNRDLQQLQVDLDRYNSEWEELVEALDGLNS
jgi:ATP-binding cassette subfamily F protein 3